MGNPVVHFEITGKNAPALHSFYSKLFGWQIDASNPMHYGMVATGSKEGIAGGIGPAMQGLAPLTFYVQVDDLAASLAKAEKLGGKTTLPPMAIPDAGLSIAQFADPEGNTIGLYKPGA